MELQNTDAKVGDNIGYITFGYYQCACLRDFSICVSQLLTTEPRYLAVSGAEVLRSLTYFFIFSRIIQDFRRLTC